MSKCCLCETLIWHQVSVSASALHEDENDCCVSLSPLYLSLSQLHATLGSTQPPYLWPSSRPRTSASPLRPVTTNSQVRSVAAQTLTQRRLSTSHAAFAATESNSWLPFPKAKISAISSKSRQYLLPSSFCHHCTWKACLIVLWCASGREFGRSDSSFMSISHYFWDSVYCDRWRQSKGDFEVAAFNLSSFLSPTSSWIE